MVTRCTGHVTRSATADSRRRSRVLRDSVTQSRGHVTVTLLVHVTVTLLGPVTARDWVACRRATRTDMR